MANVTVATYDGNGSRVGESQVSIPDEIVNADLLLTKALRAVTANAAFLGNQSPSNAQILAQVRSLTQQVTMLILLRTGRTDDLTGT